jgi:predicted RNA-binding protein with PUA-like domain
MRDQMRVGDGVFFYQSNAKQIGIVGSAKVIKTGYADYTAWDPKDIHYDPKSTPERPIWFMVDIEIVNACATIITLKQLKSIAALNDMGVVQRGNRLSVQPVSPEAWETILKLPEWN